MTVPIHKGKVLVQIEVANIRFHIFLGIPSHDPKPYRLYAVGIVWCIGEELQIRNRVV